MNNFIIDIYLYLKQVSSLIKKLICLYNMYNINIYKHINNENNQF